MLFNQLKSRIGPVVPRSAGRWGIMTRTMYLFVLTLCGSNAQSILQVSGPGNAKAGQSIPLAISLNSPNQTGSIASIQFTINFPSDVTGLAGTAGAASTAANKQLACGTPRSGTLTCLLFGLNTTIFGPGVVANLTVTLSNSPGASEAFSLTGTLGANAAGNPVSLGGGNPLTIPVLSKCDLNSDGTVNAVDVLAIVNWILGISTPPTGVNPDLNGDGALDLFDAALLIVSATGGACLAQ